MTPRTKFKFPKPYYAFLGHPKTYSKIWFVYFTKCRRNSGKQDFLWKSFCLTNFLTPMTTEDFVKPFYKTKWHSIESSSKSSVCLFIRCKSSLKKKKQRERRTDDRTEQGNNNIPTIFHNFKCIFSVSIEEIWYFQA